MQSKLLGFAFSGTNSELVLDTIKSDLFIEKHVIHSSVDSIQYLLDIIADTKPLRILGLGLYSGRDMDLLRNENIAKNSFRSNRIGRIPSVKISTFFKPSNSAKDAVGMGNSWCNLVSYKIATQFKDIPLTFIHIPRGYHIESAAREIERQLNSL